MMTAHAFSRQHKGAMPVFRPKPPHQARRDPAADMLGPGDARCKHSLVSISTSRPNPASGRGTSGHAGPNGPARVLEHPNIFRPGSVLQPPQQKANRRSLGLLRVIGMVGLTGFEPVTSRLSGVRSDQLSYRPSHPKIIALSTSSYNIRRQPLPHSFLHIFNNMLWKINPDITIYCMLAETGSRTRPHLWTRESTKLERPAPRGVGSSPARPYRPACIPR
jgi:hypothetical protein